MHTYCCYKEELPIELCKGLVNIGRELNKEEAKVFKEGDDINNICNKCKQVKYCNAACKKKHRQKHKKECERRVGS